MKIRLSAFALACALLCPMAFAQTIEADSCGARNGSRPISGEWKWQIGDYGGHFEGSFYQCGVAEYIRESALQICVRNNGIVTHGQGALVSVPLGTPVAHVLLRCQQWSQSLRFKVMFREFRDQDFVSLYF